MEYPLSNGTAVTIRTPQLPDAQSIMDVIAAADTETRFLAREPGEFSVTLAQEEAFLEAANREPDMAWFVAEYQGRVVGQASVSLVRKSLRYRHRAQVALVLLKAFWGMGIGGKMMQRCIDWCREKNVAQLELSVIADNDRALKLYRSFGFRTVGTIPKALRYADGTYADELLMVLDLS